MEKCNVESFSADPCVLRDAPYNLTKEYGSFVVRDENGNDITDKCGFAEYSDGSTVLTIYINGISQSCTFSPTIIKYSPFLNLAERY